MLTYYVSVSFYLYFCKLVTNQVVTISLMTVKNESFIYLHTFLYLLCLLCSVSLTFNKCFVGARTQWQRGGDEVALYLGDYGCMISMQVYLCNV